MMWSSLKTWCYFALFFQAAAASGEHVAAEVDMLGFVPGAQSCAEPEQQSTEGAGRPSIMVAKDGGSGGVVSLLSLRTSLRKKQAAGDLSQGYQGLPVQRHQRRENRTSFKRTHLASLAQGRTRLGRRRALTAITTKGTRWATRRSQAHTEVRTTLTTTALATAVALLEKRKIWLVSHNQTASHFKQAEKNFDQFIESLKKSGTACSVQLLLVAGQLKSLTEHVTALTTQMEAHQQVITTSTEDLKSTDAALADSLDVYNAALASCATQRKQAAAKFVQYTTELDELAQIASPDVRSDMAGVGDVATDAMSEAVEKTGPQNVSLLEERVSIKTFKPGSPSSWSKQKCLAFVRFQTRTARRTFQTPNATVINETSAGGNEDVQACEVQLTSLQVKFEEAYHNLMDLKATAKREMSDEECDSLARTEHDAQTVPLTTQREHATDKIEESYGAVTELVPVVNLMEKQSSTFTDHITTLKQECAETQGLSKQLAAVRRLIASTASCPGIQHTKLEIPSAHCKTNGRTCSWTCSEKGNIFNSGFMYGHLASVHCEKGCTSCPPLQTEEEGRAFCERKCIENIYCVAFVHDWKEESCELYFDVLDGSFKQAPEVASTGEKKRWSCFLNQRVDSVNHHRDPKHPLTDHHFIQEYWFYYENQAEWWEQWEPDEAYYYYEPVGEKPVVDDATCSLGDPTQYGGPPSDKDKDWAPTNAMLEYWIYSDKIEGSYNGSDVSAQAYHHHVV